MGRYRKKPVEVEAFKMTKARRLDNSGWPLWLHEAWQKAVTEPGALFCSADGCFEGEKCTPLFINTLKGLLRVEWDAFIIKGVQNELYPCKLDIFEATYEAVTE